jgi:hypothetical protein
MADPQLLSAADLTDMCTNRHTRGTHFSVPIKLNWEVKEGLGCWIGANPCMLTTRGRQGCQLQPPPEHWLLYEHHPGGDG